MGIRKLLRFVKKASREVNIRSYSGCVVAVDTYCWLHKGAFSCGEKLAKGEKTDGYIRYCMKFVNMLVAAGIKPILVFDGRNLPSKKQIELKRREIRETNRKKAVQFLREGKTKEAQNFFQRSIDITPEMALELIKMCRMANVDCIVAPYEADAQLAYLNKCGIADIVITEDSDLLLFGCERVLFKMDLNGHGLMVEKSCIYQCMGLSASDFSFEKFRNMCILSGCDYLPSLPGIGLVKACKVFSKVSNPDPLLVLSKLPNLLNTSKLKVSTEYKESFIKAINTFMYQLVFCPLQKKLVPLNPYPPEIDPKEITYAGEYFSDRVAYQMALGNVHLHTMEQMDNFDPAALTWNQNVNSSLNNKQKQQFKTSIWDQNYRVTKRNFGKKEKKSPVKSTRGKEVVVDTRRILRLSPSKKRTRASGELSKKNSEDEEKAIFNLYLDKLPLAKKMRLDAAEDKQNEYSEEEHHGNSSDSCVPETPPTKKAEKLASPAIVSAIAKDVPEVIETSPQSKPINVFCVPRSAETRVVKSRFFTSLTTTPAPAKKATLWLDEIDAQFDVKQMQNGQNKVHRELSSEILEHALFKVEYKVQDTPKISNVTSTKKTVQCDLGSFTRNASAFQWTNSMKITRAPHLNLKSSPAVQSAFDLASWPSQEDKSTSSSQNSASTNVSNYDDVMTPDSYGLSPDTLNISPQADVESMQEDLRGSQESTSDEKSDVMEDDISIVKVGESNRKEKSKFTCLWNSKSKDQVKPGKCRSVGLKRMKRTSVAPQKSNPLPSSNQQSIKAMLEKFKFSRQSNL